MYYGVRKIDEDSELDKNFQTKLEHILFDFNVSQWYYGWNYVGYNEAYSKLKQLIKEVEQILK